MADQNNDNVVFNNPGLGIPDQPMHHYQMPPNYDINPDGYAGYSNYITSRGDDSKYGAVPRFDALSYDQFQPAGGYGQMPPYGGYPQQSQYDQPYPSQNYFQNPAPSGYGYGSQYQSDPYQQYDQVYDWQQSTGQMPQLRPTDPYHAPSNAPFPPASPQGYNTPRLYQEYDPYAPPARHGIELSDVVNDIIESRGQPPQRQYTQMPSYQDNAGAYADQALNQSAYRMPAEYPAGSYGAPNAGPRSTPSAFETAVFSLDDIHRQQANSLPQMPDRTMDAPSATTLDFNIPFDNNIRQEAFPPQSPAMPQTHVLQPQVSDILQPSGPQQQTFDMPKTDVSQQQYFGMAQPPSAQQPTFDAPPPSAAQQQTFNAPQPPVSQQQPIDMLQTPVSQQQAYDIPQPQIPQQQAFDMQLPVSQLESSPTPQSSAVQQQTAQQPSDLSFGQSFGEAFMARHTADIPIQNAALSQNEFSPAPDMAAGFPAFFSDPTSFTQQQQQQQQQPVQPAEQSGSVASDSDMDSLFGSVFNNEIPKTAEPVPDTSAAQPGFDFSMPFQPQADDVQNDSAAQTPAIDMSAFNALHTASAATFPQTAVPQDAMQQQSQLLQTGQNENIGLDLYPNAAHTTLEQDFTSTADFENNIFDSNFQINEPPKTEPKPAPSIRDTEIFRIAEELSQAVLIKSRSRAFNDNNTMKEDNVRLVQVDGMSSDYYISEGGVNPYRMFEDISFGLNAGSCCALVCDVPLAAYVLARSICESADQDYEDEPVRVADTVDGEAGQIMYIGSDSMLPDEMNVEDFLLYTQTGSSDDENARERLRALLSQLGMSSMQDTDLRELSYNKRILLVTLASTLNPNIVCIVINDPKFNVDAEEEMLARRIFSLINNRGKCSLVACSSAYLMSSVANRVAIVRRGRLEFFDEYKKFLDDYCLGIMSFNSDKPTEVTRELEAKYPDLSVLCQEKLVYLVRKKGSPDIDLAALIKDVINLGADYNSIVMDEKSFVMACKEALGKG